METNQPPIGLWITLMILGKTQKKQRGDLLMVPDLPPPPPVEIWKEKVIKSKMGGTVHSSK